MGRDIHFRAANVYREQADPFDQCVGQQCCTAPKSGLSWIVVESLEILVYCKCEFSVPEIESDVSIVGEGVGVPSEEAEANYGV